jgi:4-diphosphocytidyl-2-C-methyl-D-erythritol kinase
MNVSVFSPAKINLFLAVTGRRTDGFHDLLSVVAPLDFGDFLEAASKDRRAGSQFTIQCDHPDVPSDGTNLVLRAAEAFAVATGWQEPVHFRLTKRIPVGAGFGGGSSNAVATLRALNQLAGGLLDEARLTGVAAQLGSDCTLFLANAPVVMRGRGDRIEALPARGAARLRGTEVLLFKPSFGISTPWAYQRMAARGGDYLAAAEAGSRLDGWLDGESPVADLLFNNMEPAAFEKYVALPVLLEKLRTEFGVATGMSGSGSACYALLGDDQVAAPLVAQIRACWGAGAFVQDARFGSAAPGESKIPPD